MTTITNIKHTNDLGIIIDLQAAIASAKGDGGIFYGDAFAKSQPVLCSFECNGTFSDFPGRTLNGITVIINDVTHISPPGCTGGLCYRLRRNIRRGQQQGK